MNKKVFIFIIAIGCTSLNANGNPNPGKYTDNSVNRICNNISNYNIEQLCWEKVYDMKETLKMGGNQIGKDINKIKDTVKNYSKLAFKRDQIIMDNMLWFQHSCGKNGEKYIFDKKYEILNDINQIPLKDNQKIKPLFKEEVVKCL